MQPVGALAGDRMAVERKVLSAGPVRARRKFLRYCAEGFRDETYLDWERSYKWETHFALGRDESRRLLQKGDYTEVSARLRTAPQSRLINYQDFRQERPHALKAFVAALCFQVGILR